MNKIVGLLFLSFVLLGCQNTKRNDSSFQLSGVVENYHELLSAIQIQDDKIYVINFWATWCVPCVEELPEFVKLYNENKDRDDFEMVLVSLDRSADYDTKVKSFVAKNSVTPPVVVLSDVKRMNEWIPTINKSWSGAIPATAVYKNGKQLFFKEGSMTYEELKEIINK